MLTIYSSDITPRLSYVIETLFEDIIGVPVLLTRDKTRLTPSQPCLNYSHETISGVNFIRPHSLLFEEGIRTIAEVINEEGLIFPVDSDIIDQDIFAASFFLLSRYEEYLDQDSDPHGRRMAKNSKMYQARLLDRPLVDEWVLYCYDQLKINHPELPTPQRVFTILPTFDIDIAYAYRGRGMLRKWKSTLKDVGTLKTKRIKERNTVLRGDSKDPYDSYDYQRSSCAKLDLEARHFFLLGDRGPLDHNLAHGSDDLIALIKVIDGWSSIGIHPSMGSNTAEKKLKKEIERLKAITGKEVVRSRQHYLYIDLPTTYQRLVAAGITEDYSMGYADHTGFRAGTCSSFRWYDLSREEITPLYLIPITVMDSTVKDYMKLNPVEAIKHISQLKENVKAVNGIFIPLWHNHSVSGEGEWGPWREVFESSISKL